MGLFSKKKESHTIQEALANKDEKFSYTTRTGYTYDNFPFLMQERLYQPPASMMPLRCMPRIL